MPDQQEPHSILHALPPELRNLIYSYLTTPSSIPHTSRLPLKLRTFTDKHTLVQVCPAHFGSPFFLQLQKSNVLEGAEYESWLLNHSITLHIGIDFTGRVQTFIVGDWTKKIAAHLNKLLRQHTWLGKVSRYEIKIRWAPSDGVLRSKNGKCTAGKMVREMVASLTGIMRREMKRKRADVKVEVVLEHRVALQYVLDTTARFGIKDFLDREMDADGHEYAHLDMRVSKTPFVPPSEPLVRVPCPLVPVPKMGGRENMLVLEGDELRWAESVKGELVVREFDGVVVEFGGGVGAGRGRSGNGSGGRTDFVMGELVEEYLEKK